MISLKTLSPDAVRLSYLRCSRLAWRLPRCSEEKAETKEIVRPVKVVEIAKAERHPRARLFRLGEGAHRDEPRLPRRTARSPNASSISATG